MIRNSSKDYQQKDKKVVRSQTRDLKVMGFYKRGREMDWEPKRRVTKPPNSEIQRSEVKDVHLIKVSYVLVRAGEKH